MTNTEFRTATEQLILLVSCAMQEKVPDREQVAQMNPEHLYEVASFHQLAAAAGMALESAGVKDERFQQAVARAQRKTILLDQDRAAVLSDFEQHGIWYMPLKGSVLKNRYPRFGMREMADNDILADPERMEEIRQIMLDRGFTVESFGIGNHDVYYKKPVSNFEIHHRLFSKAEDPKLAAYYENVKDRLIKDENNQFGYHFSETGFYLYITAHEYKHFEGCGTGLRSLLDTFVYLLHWEPDWDEVSRKAEKMGIAEFEKNNRELAQKLFRGEPLSAKQQEMLDQITAAGTYGQLEIGISKNIAKKGRLGYFFSRLSLPMEDMQGLYPVLKKAPFLYPVCWAVRLIRAPFHVNQRRKALLEMKTMTRKNNGKQNEGGKA